MMAQKTRTYGRSYRNLGTAAPAPVIKSSLWISPIKATPFESVFQDSSSQIHDDSSSDATNHIAAPEFETCDEENVPDRINPPIRTCTKLSTRSRTHKQKGSDPQIKLSDNVIDDDSFQLFTVKENVKSEIKNKNTRKKRGKKTKTGKKSTHVFSAVAEKDGCVGADFSSIDNFELVISNTAQKNSNTDDDDDDIINNISPKSYLIHQQSTNPDDVGSSINSEYIVKNNTQTTGVGVDEESNSFNAPHLSQFDLHEVPEKAVNTPCQSDFSLLRKPSVDLQAPSSGGSVGTSTPYVSSPVVRNKDKLLKPKRVADNAPHQSSSKPVPMDRDYINSYGLLNDSWDVARSVAGGTDINSASLIYPSVSPQLQSAVSVDCSTQSSCPPPALADPIQQSHNHRPGTGHGDVEPSPFLDFTRDSVERTADRLSQNYGHGPVKSDSNRQSRKIVSAEGVDEGDGLVVTPCVVENTPSTGHGEEEPSPFLGFTQDSIDRTTDHLSRLHGDFSALHDGRTSSGAPAALSQDHLACSEFRIKKSLLQVDRINTPDLEKLLSSRSTVGKKQLMTDPSVCEYKRLNFDSPSEEIVDQQRVATNHTVATTVAVLETDDLNECFKNLNIQSSTQPDMSNGNQVVKRNENCATDRMDVDANDDSLSDLRPLAQFRMDKRKTCRFSLVPKLFHETVDIDCEEIESTESKLYKQCEKEQSVSFSEAFKQCLQSVIKIGEGQCGEVFQAGVGSECVCFKVIPVNGEIDFNGEKQKDFDEILAEVIIAKELSALRNNSQNSTQNFVKLNSVNICHGPFPAELLEAWDDYHKRNISENDRPDIFAFNQLYMVFQCENAGVDLELYQFESANQALSCVSQVSCALAVAECQLQFEHRDLHWGNILIKSTCENTITYKLMGQSISVPTHGIIVTVIDFTLSRLETGGCVVFCDLKTLDWLFTGQDDLQFAIYRLMKDHNNNDWEQHTPYSNVLWLYYLLDKLNKVKLVQTKAGRKTQGKGSAASLRQLRSFSRRIRQCNSAVEVIQDFQLYSSTPSL